MGAATTNKLENVIIMLNRCTGSTECKSKEEIDAIAQNLAIVYFYNTSVYSPDKYGDETISEEAHVGYYTIAPDQPVALNIDVQKNTLESHEDIISLGINKRDDVEYWTTLIGKPDKVTDPASLGGLNVGLNLDTIS